MINVGVLTTSQLVLSAVRSVLGSSCDVNVRFSHCSEAGDDWSMSDGGVDVLVCEPVSLRALKRVLAKCEQRETSARLRILYLGKPPSERVLRNLIGGGVLGFVGVTAADFYAMPKAVRAVAAGQFYLPSGEDVALRGEER